MEPVGKKSKHTHLTICVYSYLDGNLLSGKLGKKKKLMAVLFFDLDTGEMRMETRGGAEVESYLRYTFLKSNVKYMVVDNTGRFHGWHVCRPNTLERYIVIVEGKFSPYHFAELFDSDTGELLAKKLPRKKRGKYIPFDPLSGFTEGLAEEESKQ